MFNKIKHNWLKLVYKSPRIKMSAPTKYDPPVNRTMKQLDRSFFQKKIPLVVVQFPNPKHIGLFTKNYKRDLLNLPNISPIIKLGDKKGVLLNDNVCVVEEYEKHVSPETLEAIRDYDGILEPYELTLDYNFWKPDEILKAILPNTFHEEIPSGFTSVGHVAHINLKEEYRPYGNLIGQVILDKNSKIRTVVNKTDNIATKFRTFQMEVIAGEPDLLVEQKESNCRFQFDFSKVYWNSRLHTEHDRLIQVFESGSVVGDVFAGVGPFAIPAGKKDVIVLANDLNPEGYKYLVHNIDLNHVERFVKPFNLDGREFIRKSIGLLHEWADRDKAIEKPVKRRRHNKEKSGEIPDDKPISIEIPKYVSHYVMNLPDSSITFLNEFIGLYGDDKTKAVVKTIPDFKMPTLNVHCFEKFDPNESEPTDEELHRRVLKRISDMIQYDLPLESCKFHLVRKVAPTKPMFCVSFQLPEEVAYRSV